MANEKSECKELCKKYTTLRDEEIEEIYPFLSDLQNLADKEESNVYIDCMTYTGKSMVIVGEAFPASRGTIYTEPLFGKIMYTKNEPAVARTFSTGIPTKNVTGEEVISSRVMIQQVYPIKHGAKTVAVLIFEKLYDRPEHDPESEMKERVRVGSLLSDTDALLDSLNEGVMLVDENDNICYYNEFVKGVFDELGYVGEIFGMEAHNILGNDSSGRYRFQMRGHTLDGKVIDIHEGGVKYGVILDDITEKERLNERAADYEFKIHEERHSIKNGLLFLTEFARQKAENAPDEAEKAAFSEMQDRIGMLQSVTELKLQNEGSVGLREALEYVFIRKLDLAPNGKEIDIEIKGDDVTVNDEACNSIISIVYELICNSMKHAFGGRDSGSISIEISKGYVTSSITYTDDGTGFDPEALTGDTHGLEIIRTLVTDKLSGVMKIDSGDSGTKVFFDFIQ